MSGKAPSSPSSTLLDRFYPHLLVLSGVAVALGITSLYNLYVSTRAADANGRKQQRQLRRRNARRVARPRASSYPHTGSATSGGSTGSLNAAMHESLSVLDGNSANAAANINGVENNARTSAEVDAAAAIDGITLPQDETITAMLNNAGAVARGNRGETDDGVAVGGENEGDGSEFSYMVQQQEPKESHENQNVLQLLYLIAEDQAKQQGYVHRGVTCNLCNVLPITGIRYRCSNCIDFDLCESCEAQDVHPKTHLFYKVRIPAPFLGNPKKIQPPVYPGKPSLMPLNIPLDTLKRFSRETSIDQTEVEALYEQFKCLAATEFPDDPNGLSGAINRTTFDKCFVPNNSLRPPPPNLIYDRMFAFYDTDGNGLIGFEEFVKGLSIRSKRSYDTKNNRIEGHRRVFRSYDLNDDGYIERKDVLRMFRAYYALQKDLMKDLIAGMDEDVVEQNQTATVLAGSQPISAAFATGIPQGDRRRPVKSREDDLNDVPREALAPDQDELGIRSETIERAKAERKQAEEARQSEDAANDHFSQERSDQRAAERAERRRLEREVRASMSGAAGGANANAEDSQAGPSSATTAAAAAAAAAGGTNTSAVTADTAVAVAETVAAAAAPAPTVATGNPSNNNEGNISPVFNFSPHTNVTRRWSNETRSPRDTRRVGDLPWANPAQLSNGFPHRRMSLATPQLAEFNFEPSAFAGSPFAEWATANARDDQEPGREPSDEERKLYYLEDYYRSDDEADAVDEDDGWKNAGMERRRRLMGKSGLDKEEDVGREILCQVTEQGINELLDLLFLSKEKEGLEAMKNSPSAFQTELSLLGDEDWEKPSSASSSPLKSREGASSFTVVAEGSGSKTPGGSSNGSSSIASLQSQARVGKMKAEIKARGGPGRINEEEFVTVMEEEGGRKLSFMSIWVNMGSF